MSDRAAELATTYIRVLAADDGKGAMWGVDVWGTWFSCDGDSKADVALIAGDIRDRAATALRAYAEEAIREERNACEQLARDCSVTAPGYTLLVFRIRDAFAAAIRARGRDE